MGGRHTPWISGDRTQGDFTDALYNIPAVQASAQGLFHRLHPLWQLPPGGAQIPSLVLKYFPFEVFKADGNQRLPQILSSPLPPTHSMSPQAAKMEKAQESSQSLSQGPQRTDPYSPFSSLFQLVINI